MSTTPVSTVLRGLAHAAAVVAIVAAAASTAAPQPRQPFSEDAVRHLVRGALLQYFDPDSVFEISVAGTALSGDVLIIEDLLVVGKPALLRGVRGEVLAHVTGLHLDMAALAGQQFRIVRLGKATVVGKSTARDVQEGLARMSPNILRPTVRFQVGQFEVAATIRREGKLYPALARGNLTVEQEQRIRVVVTEAQVRGSDVPPGLVESELTKLNPVLDLSKWPFNMRIQRLVLHNDAIEMLATSGR
ncbi:MAG: LmeA family phospholipid-binding protein [Gemmatimonadetes bacterium]|nr:LmeA family phospholipid-binding protein [Gemmatimonadota bacterium]